MPSMPQTVRRDQDETHPDDVVVGVDTHKNTHTAAVITLLGALLATATFPATAAGYQQLVAWARGFGTLRRAGVEGTGSYGAALSRYLRCEGVEVIEVNQPDKATRRRRGKTDVIDAESAARAVLSGRAIATAKAGDGPVEMMRIFKLAKESAVKARTQTINQLKAVLGEAAPPGAHRVHRDAHLGSDLGVGLPLGGPQHDLRAGSCPDTPWSVPAPAGSGSAAGHRLSAPESPPPRAQPPHSLS